MSPAQIQWITFHSGYDFGYLLKILTCQPLPATDAEFFEILQVLLVQSIRTCHASMLVADLEFSCFMPMSCQSCWRNDVPPCMLHCGAAVLPQRVRHKVPHEVLR